MIKGSNAVRGPIEIVTLANHMTYNFPSVQRSWTIRKDSAKVVMSTLVTRSYTVYFKHNH